MTARTLLLTCALALAPCGCGPTDPPDPPPALPPEMLGRWRDDIDAHGTIEFRRDGAALMDGPFGAGDGRYWVLPRNRVAIDMDGWEKVRGYTYRLRGDRLTLKPDPPAIPHEYTRAK